MGLTSHEGPWHLSTLSPGDPTLLSTRDLTWISPDNSAPYLAIKICLKSKQLFFGTPDNYHER